MHVCLIIVKNDCTNERMKEIGYQMSCFPKDIEKSFYSFGEYVDFESNREHIMNIVRAAETVRFANKETALACGFIKELVVQSMDHHYTVYAGEEEVIIND